MCGYMSGCGIHTAVTKLTRRRLTRDLNLLVVAMLEDGCSSINCPEMRTLDCQYLCAAHDKPRECPATDYIVHTLDYTTALLNSSKLFPSRYCRRMDMS